MLFILIIFIFIIYRYKMMILFCFSPPCRLGEVSEGVLQWADKAQFLWVNCEHGFRGLAPNTASVN